MNPTHKNRNIIIAIVVIIGLLAFYWFSFRPYQVTKLCIQTSLDRVTEIKKETGGGDQTDARYFFWKCQKQHGIGE